VPAAQGGAAAGAAAAAGVSLAENFPLYGAIRILPVARINSVMVVTPRAEYLEEARRWIEKLDQPSDNGSEPQLFIYQVQNVNARHLATVLSGIFSGMQNPFQSAGTGATGVSPALSGTAGGNNAFNNNMGNFNNNPYGGGNNNQFGGGFNNYGGGFGGGVGGNVFGQSAGSGFGSGGLLNLNQRNQANNNRPSISVTASFGNIRVVADELNNSVLIWATKSEYDRIEGTLKRLDIPPTQVMIEASIIEVSLVDDLSYGLQWAFSDQRPGGRTGGNTGQGIIGGNPDLFDPTKVAGGFTYSLTNTYGRVRAVLQALSETTNLKVVSSPSLMVLDNHTATIAVGEQQPVRTSDTTWVNSGGATTSTIQYKDTGVNLVVTPSVNAGNLVTMQIDQMLTDIMNSSYGNTAQPAFMQRQISSKVAVRSGDAIVLGGLIKDTDQKTKSGVPILSQIPVVGALFGQHGTNNKRTELLVVISPRVVRTDIDIREISDELRDRMKGLRDFNGLTRDPKPTVSAPPLAAPTPQ
ncbi:secretin N-terminal domain-containing protein, partial [Diaphorobacter sp.]|uniref:secretin N-terminal domain-containing protein n=1 Tax=Diaphorobacter sp. TaxID=1934310 RepID=UPI0028ABC98D